MSIKTSVDLEKDLQIRLTTIREELQNLINARNTLREELKKIREELADRRSILTELKGRLKKVKEELTSLYNQLNNTKKEIADLREKLRLNINQIKEISTLLKKCGTQLGMESIDNIKEEIERLEWILITTPNLDIEEEKKIIERISQLEKRLKEISLSQRGSLELHIKYKELSSDIDNIKNILRERTNFIGHLRERIEKLRNERDRIKREVSDVINSIIELKKRRDELLNRIAEVSNAINSKYVEYRNVIKELKRLKELKERNMLSEQLKHRRKEIMDKIERGERITIDELYIAFSDSLSKET